MTRPRLTAVWVIPALVLAAVIAGFLISPDDEEVTETTGPLHATSGSARPEIAFFRADDGYSLGVSNDRGRILRVLASEGEGELFPQLFTRIAWQPRGGELAFAGVAATESTDEHDEETAIYVIGADGSDPRQLTSGAYDGAPVFSLDGKTILFSRAEEDLFGGEVWAMNADGSDQRRLMEANAGEWFIPSSFDPDGSRFAATRVRPDEDSGQYDTSVVLVDADGSNVEDLIPEAADPSFSWDGNRIAYVSTADENGELCYGDRCITAGELYVASADGSGARRLTDTRDLNEANPSWSVLGSRIAFQRGERFQNAEATSILEINADGSCQHVVLSGSGSGAWYASPAFRPSIPDAGTGPVRC